jgi:hypothetical protein
LKKVFQSRLDGEGFVRVERALDVVVVCEVSEAVGDVVDAWRQSEGVKNEDGVDVGVLHRRGGR